MHSNEVKVHFLLLIVHQISITAVTHEQKLCNLVSQKCFLSWNEHKKWVEIYWNCIPMPSNFIVYWQWYCSTSNRTNFILAVTHEQKLFNCNRVRIVFCPERSMKGGIHIHSYKVRFIWKHLQWNFYIFLQISSTRDVGLGQVDKSNGFEIPPIPAFHLRTQNITEICRIVQV